MEKKNNIMFVVPTLVGGGAEKTVANLSKYLEPYFNVNIVVIEDTPQKYSHGGNLIVLKKQDEKGAIGKITARLKRAKELRRIKKDLDIKCAISFLFQADLLNILSKRSEKCIMSVRNKDSVLLEKAVYKKIMKYCLEKCNLVVSISEQVKEDLVDNFGVDRKKVITIYNPSLVEEFKSDDAHVREDVFGKKFTFINVARLTEQKGQWHLIRAFRKVVEDFPDAKLLILGTGELKDYLQKLIEDLNLSENVTLLGFVDNPYDYLKRSDAFVFSSLFEGLGNSILEAMACGLPVISTDCDYGPREILEPNSWVDGKTMKHYKKAEYGVLCPVFDGSRYGAEELLTEAEKSYAEAMLEISKEPKVAEHYSKMSKIRIADFNINKIVKKWKEVIND